MNDEPMAYLFDEQESVPQVVVKEFFGNSVLEIFRSLTAELYAGDLTLA